MQKGFIFPDLSLEDEENGNVPSQSVVRIAASFDTGWPTKGSGRSYDSLSGTAGLMGYFNRKILSQVVFNRKCHTCDLGINSGEEHDCRLNYFGSAKGMEPKAAVKLIKSPILIDCKVQLGIFIGDCDSSAIKAARDSVNHEIIKQDDRNHTSKGLTSQLYKMQKKHKELTSVNIQYLKECFNYCLCQNAGNNSALSNAIKNIPMHTFNKHDN